MKKMKKKSGLDQKSELQFTPVGELKTIEIWGDQSKSDSSNISETSEINNVSSWENSSDSYISNDGGGGGDDIDQDPPKKVKLKNFPEKGEKQVGGMCVSESITKILQYKKANLNGSNKFKVGDIALVLIQNGVADASSVLQAGLSEAETAKALDLFFDTSKVTTDSIFGTLENGKPVFGIVTTGNEGEGHAVVLIGQETSGDGETSTFDCYDPFVGDTVTYDSGQFMKDDFYSIGGLKKQWRSKK